MTPHRGGGTGGHPTARRLASAALACALVSGWDAGTQRLTTSPDADCVAAAEPNDDVDHAQVLPSTETCVIATHENGSQDMFMWTVTPEAAGQRWTMTTTGIPGQAETLQVHRLHVDEAGVLTGSDNLASVGTGPGEGAALENLMLPAGEYLVGIGFTGAGPYELHIAPGDAAPAAVEVEPNDSQDQATPLSGELAASGDRAGSTSDWYSWTVDAVAAEQPWELLVQGAVGTSPGVRLIDEDAVPLFSGAAGSDGVLRVPDIRVPAGTYFLEVAGASEEFVPYTVELRPGTAPEDGTDAEPNDRPESAVPVALAEGATTLHGRLATVGPQSDVDGYLVAVDGATAGRQTDIKLFWRGGNTRSLCLLDSTGAVLQCADGTGSIAFNDVVLAAGDYRLEVSGAADPDDPYLLRFDVTATATSGFEAEPNDTAVLASALDVSGDHPTGAGRVSQGDVDVFRWTVTGEPQLWEITASGPGVERIDALEVTGFSGVHSNAVDGAARLTDIFLLPGDHTFSVIGNSGDYTIEAVPLGPPAPDAEREPNDRADHSQPVRLLERRTGRLPLAEDVDYYRFSLQNETHVEIGVDSPADGQLAIDLDSGSERLGSVDAAAPGEGIAYEAVLGPGDYVLVLSSIVPSEERYAITIETADPFDVPDDAEPNDTPARARPIPADLTATGTFATSYGDADWYAVPAAAQPGTVDIEVAGESVSIQVTTAATAGQPATALTPIPGAEAGAYTVDVPADAPILIGVQGAADYALSVAPPPGVDTGERAGEAPLAIELTGCDQPVAAYWVDRQRLACEVSVTNEGDTALDVVLDGVTGHYAWTIDLPADPLSVAAGETATAPVAVGIAPDAWADQPILVTVRATAGMGEATASTNVVPTGDAPPLEPSPDEPLPVELLGGLDVAWSALGAAPIAADESAAAEEAQLFDQLTPVGAGWQGDASILPAELTVDLAGDDAVPVAGITLNPQGGGSVPGDQLRGFDLELSMDGQTFRPALSGELAAIPVEQAFALPEPIEARFARLRVRSAQNPATTVVVIGEWAVIATPGWTPGPLEISDLALGGHVVAQDPPSAGYTVDYANLLVDDEIRQTVESVGGAPVSWTVGFHHDRAAQISSLEWLDPAGTDPAAQLTQVAVEVSVDSPTGPWLWVGTWTLDRSSGNPTLTLDDPVWARFVRFTGAVAGTGDPSAEVVAELPDEVRIVERPPGADYLPAVGEWGHNRRAAMYERLNPRVAVELDEDAGNDAASATAIGMGELHTDSAWVEADEDWFRVTAPPGENALAVTLTGIPTVDVDVAVLDADGEELDIEIRPSAADELTVTAVVEPGADYLVRVTEPPSSIVFAFDTSMSIGPYSSAVYAGLVRYAGDVRQGQETVNIFPFGGQMLLDESSDESFLLQAAITNYPQSETSSNAEGALMASMEQLAEQPGARAVMLITDAQTGPTLDELSHLWPQFAAVSPRVYAVHIAGGTPVDQDLMEDWASVNDGAYTYVRNQGEMDIAFDRAATVLRRPAIYTLSVEPTEPPAPPTTTTTTSTTTTSTTTTSTTSTTTSTSTTPPAPGTLSVLAAPTQPGVPLTAGANASVAIILDTSGSMLQDLQGVDRIDVAQAALTELVTQTIPAGTPVSLRVFGDVPDSCDTRLLVPQSPLDPAAMAGVIQNVPVVNDVRTPIGASLTAVAGDLGTAPGPKIVVLVTDGEETCGGDPAAAIAALNASGIDVRVNIVGFALDDEALKAQFEQWAELGNGQYIDAGNQAELTAAVAAAVQPTYDVVAADGTLVASGQAGGEPVSVPAGPYTVVVHSTPERRFTVEVPPGQPVEVQL